MTGLTVKAVMETFTNSTILKIEEEPDFTNIKAIKKLIITNASSCKSELGGGQHGILGLVMPDTRHQTITGSEFVPCINP